MNVLVVEDDPNLSFLWGTVLEQAGHDVFKADSETAAHRMLAERTFDLVLLDLCVGGRDSSGVTAVAASCNPECQVVLVTGSANFSKRAHFAMLPAVVAVLRKPVNIEDLVEVCARSLEYEAPLASIGGGTKTVESRP